MAIMERRLVCPQCRVIYSPGQRFCTEDGTDLVSYQDEALAESKDPLVGQLLDGRYLIKRVLGEGGMGTVYAAQRPNIEKLFAVKVLKQDLVGGEIAIKRFLREARVLSRLSHDHIVSVHDYGQTSDGLYYLVMEYLHGIPLDSYLSQMQGKRIYPSQMVEIMIQIALALRYAHDHKVVHRDIKPANILLTIKDGEGDFVKVLDFGIARLTDQEGVTRLKDGIPGTPTYAAPEMFLGGDYLTPALDMYALGIMMFECLAGDPPFMGSDLRLMFQHGSEIPPLISTRCRNISIPSELDQLIARLLHKEPSSRPSAAQLLESLSSIRPKLPPRSLQSILYMNTKVLSRIGTSGVQSEEDVGKAQKLAGELDSLESLVAQASEQLAKRIRVVIRRLWSAGVPGEIESTAKAVAQLEIAEENAAVQVALRREELRQVRLAANAQEAARRERYLILREQERASPRAAAAIQDEIAALEREGAAAAASVASFNIEGELQKLDSLRAQLHEQRRQLAERILRAASRRGGAELPDQAQMLRTLEAALQQLESVSQAYEDVNNSLREE